MCDARRVDPLSVAIVGTLLVGLAVLAAVTIARGRELEEVRVAAGAAATTDGARAAVRRLAASAEAISAELGRRRDDLVQLADLVGVGIVRLDENLRIEFANGTAHVLLGRAPGSMIGRPALEAFVDGRIEAVARGARDGGSASEEVVIRDADGPALIARARRSPIGGVWLVLEDVAELRRLQRMRAEFIDNLSHELRTPLSTVGLLAETLRQEAEAAGDAIPARMRDRIAKIEVETGHLGQMVTELLDLARIESGRAPVTLADVDLGAVAAASAERLRLFSERQGIQLRLSREAGLPPVLGDEDRLGQVFVNLIHNAVKFSPNGGEVAISVRRSGDLIVAEVADEGAGIAAADRPRIFERFYKADRARARSGGTGLGLAIARHIVEAHRGRITVESEEGRGSTFTVSLPAAPESAEERARLIALAAASSARAPEAGVAR